MKKTVLIMFTLVLFALATSPLMAHGKTKRMVVQLKGQAEAFLRDVPAPDGGQILDAICFEVPMFDVRTNKQLGVAFDCLSDIDLSGDPRVALTDTTIFEFKKGTLVSYGRVAIEPIKEPNEPDTEPIGAAPDSTHITGSVPPPGTQNVIAEAGTNKFKGRTGSVRLSGAVNMSDFDAVAGVGSIVFDCLFVINLDKRKNGR
jgi:hypothetical protein